jgi:hypothetical protein
MHYSQLGFYVQDQWQVRRNLVLNYGLRYDLDWPDKGINVISGSLPFRFEQTASQDRKTAGPRFGFTYDLRGNGRFVLRTGYGLYHQNLMTASTFISRVLSGQISQVFLPITGLPGFTANSADVWRAYSTNGSLGTGTLGKLGLTPGTTPSVILTGSSNFEHPYSQHSSLGVETQVGRNATISMDYTMNRGIHILRSRDVNVRRVGPNQYALPGLDPRFLQVNALESSASSSYHGFSAVYRRRFSESYGLNISYDLSKAIDDVSDFTTDLQSQDQNDLRSERSLSTLDQRHRLVISGVFQPRLVGLQNHHLSQFVTNWTAAPIVTWSSGRPFNLLAGFDANGDSHADTDRPRLLTGGPVGRNTGQGPSYFNVDFRLARKLNVREKQSLELVVEAFNILNKVNYSGVNNVIGALPLTSPRVTGDSHVAPNRPLGFTASFPARQLQLGMRFSF